MTWLQYGDEPNDIFFVEATVWDLLDSWYSSIAGNSRSEERT
jgi:hypothetical protein